MNHMETQRQNRLLRNVLFVFFVSGAASQPLGSFIPFLRETYGFSYDLSGLLLSCQSAGNLAAVALTGFLPVWLGRRRSILMTSIWMAAAYLIFSAGLGSPAALMAACLMTGVARGGNANFANTMISTLPAEKASWGFNLLHGSFAIGALLSPALLVLCTTLLPREGWRLMAAGLCLLALVQAAVYLRMELPEEPAKAGGRTVDLSFLRVRQFWLGNVMLLMYMSVEYAIMGWLVTYFQDAGILPRQYAHLMNSLLWLVIFCGRMGGAALSGRFPRERLLLADGGGMLAFFLVMFFGRTPALIILGMMGVGLFMATIYPLCFAISSDSIKGNDLGCSVMLLTGSAGGMITPAVVGFVSERAGIRSGMALVLALTAALLAAIVVSVVIAGRQRSRRAE